MTFWIKRASVFVVAGIVYLAGQYFRGVWWPKFTWPFPCREIHFGSTTYCNSPYLDSIGWPLIGAGEFLALAGVIMLFANQRGWRRWLIFSLFYIPIATALVLWIYPFQFNIGFILSSGTEVSRSVGVENFGQLYLLITLCIVLVSRFQERKKRLPKP